MKRGGQRWLRAQERDEAQSPVKEKQSGADATDDPGIKERLAERHQERHKRDQGNDAEKVEAPGKVEAEESQVASLEVEEEVIPNWFAGEMGIFGGKVVTYREVLDNGGVRSEVAPFIVPDKQRSVLVIEGGEHQP